MKDWQKREIEKCEDLLKEKLNGFQKHNIETYLKSLKK